MEVNGKALAFPIEIVRARHGPDEGRIMFVEQIRAAVMAAPRMKLPELSGALWKAYSQGLVTEDEAQAIAELIQVRKVVPVAPPKPRRVGSRPRAPESLERRRRWTASGWLPPQLAARFTMGENAVLAVVAEQVSRHARCTLAIDHIAALAGVSRSTAKNAMREAKALGLISVETRPIRAFRHDTNIVRIVAAEWQSWVSMRRSTQGVRTVAPTNTYIYPKEKSGRSEPKPAHLRDRNADLPVPRGKPRGPQ